MYVFKNAAVRFYCGNSEKGFKTKYRFDYSKLKEILLIKNINVFQTGE